MLSWSRRVQRFVRLSRSERGVVLRALLWHAAVRLALWRRGLAASQSLESPVRDQPSAGERALSPERLARLVSAVIREGPIQGNCLSEAITLCLLLRRSGHDCALRIGARRSAAGVEAHAWVELNGVPLNESADISERFTPFPATSEPVLRWV